MTTELIHLSLGDITHRISAHLARQERAQKAEAARKSKLDGKDRSLESWSHAGASQVGAYVAVQYVSYQGSSNLTRVEALHYLASLDAGYEGRHYGLFRENPPPKPEEPEVRFTALVRHRGNFSLYAVTKRTDTRVYGRVVAGYPYLPSYLPRRSVVKLQATQADLDAVLSAGKRRDLVVEAARERYQRELGAILGKGAEDSE